MSAFPIGELLAGIPQRAPVLARGETGCGSIGGRTGRDPGAVCVTGGDSR